MKDDLPIAYDSPTPKEPDVQVYTEALAARRNVVAWLVRRDRRRQVTQWFISGYAIVATVAAAYGIGNEKVYVFDRNQDLAGREELTPMAPIIKVTRNDMEDIIKQWIVHVRTVSIDPVMNDEFRRLGAARAAGPARVAYEDTIAAFAMPTGWTRQIEWKSFGLTQIDNGEKGLWSFMVQWSEDETYQLQDRGKRQMMGTFTIQLRPSTPSERREGNSTGVWIVYHDIQEAGGKV